MPDVSVLEQGTLTVIAHNSRRSEALRFTQQVLQTLRVPASVWREWRQFARQATEVLRTVIGSSRPVGDLDE